MYNPNNTAHNNAGANTIIIIMKTCWLLFCKFSSAVIFVGETVGFWVGELDEGILNGDIDGDFDGESDGESDGIFDGPSVGVVVGVNNGDFDGGIVGDFEGVSVGNFDGT
mmetsp:Transcript_95143/g.116487  ORF Transcript_95143/g.116487 Transcript_95143/m.116487 type:complete len:110 (-) Transcript_95143:230-559(-)